MVHDEILPGDRIDVIQRRDETFFAPNSEADGLLMSALLGTDDLDSGYVGVQVHHPQALAQVRDLEVAASQFHWMADPGDPATMLGHSDGRTVAVEVLEPEKVLVTIERAEPQTVLPLSLTGFALGAVVGIILWRRLRRSRAFVAGALCLLPSAVLVTGQLVYSYLGLPDQVTPPALWSPYVETGTRALSLIGGTLLIMSLIGSVRRSIGRQRSADETA
ncbi:MAG: hypothetical protein HOV71_02325 [Hamadaea sp.]|nr:hypothetical protein [Hamadaea sp.]NUR46949.1 hypothetical protein [Hamadaea sp.]